MSNGFVEKYPATPVDRFKGELRPKTHPCFYAISSMTLWKKSLVQSSESGVIDIILANI